MTAMVMMMMMMMMVVGMMMMMMMMMLTVIAGRSKDCAHVPMTPSSEIKALLCPGHW